MSQFTARTRMSPGSMARSSVQGAEDTPRDAVPAMAPTLAETVTLPSARATARPD
jgi:hypothetical protein